MGVQERRGRQKEALRQEILDAADKLFAREGYENVSMRKIANKIEYSPTTIYLYFKDKAELFDSICDETFSELICKCEALHKKEAGDPVAYLREVMRAYIDFGLTHPNHYGVVFNGHLENTTAQHSEESMCQQVFSYLRTAVEECVEQKEFRTIDTNLTAQALWAAAHGLTSLLIANSDAHFVARNKLINHVIETMIEGLKISRPNQ